MEGMNPSTLTCAQVDAQDLDARYLAGTLSDPEAEAFEAHYFGCDRCWELVHGGAEVRGALTGPGARRRPARGGLTPRIRSSTARWMGLAAALAGVTVGLSLWRQFRPHPEPAVRGGSRWLPLTAEVRGDSLLAVWPSAPGAASYRLRLFTREGALLVEREVTDTTLALSSSVLPDPAHPERFFAQVQAEDRLRQPLARSTLQAVTPPPHP